MTEPEEPEQELETLRRTSIRSFRWPSSRERSATGVVKGWSKRTSWMLVAREVVVIANTATRAASTKFLR
jgi:hypothetical protein